MKASNHLRFALRILLPLAVTSGCASMLQPPAVDLMAFTPLPAEERVIVEPTIKYLVRQDGSEYCARITGHPVTFASRPMACAFWNIRRKVCSIVTPPETGFNYLGHELRHCFEGAFHG